MSIVFRKFIKISPPEFGGNDKKEKQKKSGNRGFVEFPRPLDIYYGGYNTWFARIKIRGIFRYIA